MRTVERKLLKPEDVMPMIGTENKKHFYKVAPKLPGFVKIGRSVRFKAGPLLRWLDRDDRDGDGDGRGQ
ncbi:MAG: hypothetical protein ACRDGM_18615 [bacterium]